MRYRILLVEDDPSVLSALVRALGEYALTSTTSAEEALTTLHAEGSTFDLIVSDKTLPGRSGLELLEEAKRFSPAKRILLTGQTESSDLLTAINRGEVYRYITKPWSPDELRREVARALEHRQLERDNAELIEELRRKNTELKALATRVADAFLRRVNEVAPGRQPAAGETTLALRDLLAAASYPTVKDAARRASSLLADVRKRLRMSKTGDSANTMDATYFDRIASDCLNELRRIHSVVDQIEDIVGQGAE